MIHTACQLREWQKQAIRDRQQLRYHLEVDTGMNRLGIQAPSVAQLAELITEASALRLEGIATHLASAEDFDDEQTGQQQDRFATLVSGLQQGGIRPRYCHHANSAAIAYRPAMGCTMVRPGLALYGYLSPAHGKAPDACIHVTPALEWRTNILTIRDVAAGERLGYYGRFRASGSMRAGVLPIGYGDGFDRRMSEGGEVLVGDTPCSVLGLVSMDLTIIDLTPVPQAQSGDEVTLIGPGLDAQVMADRCGTVAYEVLCGIGKRVPRVYCD
jgi:alanine racemase